MSEQNNPSRNFAAQLPQNIISNIAYFLVNVVIGLLLVPYFISTLGVAAYGLIPLATSITGYVAIIISSLNTSVSRFLTVDIQRGNYSAANRTFNTALFGLSAIIALMLPVVIAISWYLPLLFNVPVGQETEARILFLSVCASFLIRSWSGNFTVQLFAFNRLDLQNVVNIINLIIQTLLIVVFFIWFGPNLAYIGGAYVVGAVVASVVSIILAKKVCPFLTISIQSFDQSRVWDLCGMGWWVVINQIGSLLFLQIDLIVVNIYFGATSAGEYAIALQWVVLLRAISAVLSGVLTPIVLTCYANQQIESLVWITKSAVKLMGLTMAIPIGLVCGFAPHLLSAWVGPDYSFLAPLIILLTAHLAINLAVLPLFAINIAYNKVRIPGVLTVLMGIGYSVLAIVLSIITGWGYYGVAVAGAIILTLKNAFFTPWYATRVLDVGIHTFTRSMIPGILATVFIWIMAIILQTLFPVSTLMTLIVAGVIISLSYIMVVWLVGLTRFERNLVVMHMPDKIKRYLDDIPCYYKNS